MDEHERTAEARILESVLEGINEGRVRRMLRPMDDDDYEYLREEWMPVVFDVVRDPSVQAPDELIVKAILITEALLHDATDRRGWRQEWDLFEEETQEEIRKTWTRLVLDQLG